MLSPALYFEPILLQWMQYVSNGGSRLLNSYQRIYEVVARIPRGKVCTYGQVAVLAGNPRWARVVGYALHVNPDPDTIPCYRVVNRFGEVSRAFAFGGENRQRGMLMEDNIPFLPDGHVNLKQCMWWGE